MAKKAGTETKRRTYHVDILKDYGAGLSYKVVVSSDARQAVGHGNDPYSLVPQLIREIDRS